MTDSNRGYEYRILTIFFITWGIVFMDRLAFSFLAPIVMPKLHMTNADIGWVGFATSAVFAVSSIVFGFVSDKLGYRKKVLLPFLMGTAIFAASGVLVHTFGQLLLVRALVGFCEGPVSPLLYSMLFSVNKDSFWPQLRDSECCCRNDWDDRRPCLYHANRRSLFLANDLSPFQCADIYFIFCRSLLCERDPCGKGIGQ